MDLDTDDLLPAFRNNLSISQPDSDSALSSLFHSSVSITQAPASSKSKVFPVIPDLAATLPPPPPRRATQWSAASSSSSWLDDLPWENADVANDTVEWAAAPDRNTAVSGHHRFGFNSILTSEHLGLGMMNVGGTTDEGWGGSYDTDHTQGVAPARVFGAGTGAGAGGISFAALAKTEDREALRDAGGGEALRDVDGRKRKAMGWRKGTKY